MAFFIMVDIFSNDIYQRTVKSIALFMLFQNLRDFALTSTRGILT